VPDDNVDHLLEIPEFLQRDYDPLKWLEKYTERKDEQWWMPDLQSYRQEEIDRQQRKDENNKIKQARLDRKKRKKNIETIVLEAIQKKYNTFGRMMSIVSDVSEAEMRGAIRRLMKDNKVVKLSRRVYGVKL
jgi:ClpP class serine protease